MRKIITFTFLLTIFFLSAQVFKTYAQSLGGTYSFSPSSTTVTVGQKSSTITVIGGSTTPVDTVKIQFRFTTANLSIGTTDIALGSSISGWTPVAPDVHTSGTDTIVNLSAYKTGNTTAISPGSSLFTFKVTGLQAVASQPFTIGTSYIVTGFIYQGTEYSATVTNGSYTVTAIPTNTPIPTATPTSVPTVIPPSPTPTTIPPTPTSSCAKQPLGDFDCNGKINWTDVTSLLGKYGSRTGDTGFDAHMDLDSSGKVTFIDLYILLSNYLP